MPLKLIATISALFLLHSQSTFAQAEEGLKRISETDLKDKIHGYWIGQLTGNYIGFPFENLYDEEPIPVFIDRYYTFKDAEALGLKMNLDDRRSYTPILADALGGAWSDDDTDIEFATLHAVEEYGLDITYPEIVAFWKKHVNRYIWAAARAARDNMDTGLLPPETGNRENNHRWFGISSQLMTEIWGAFYPGMTLQAAERAEWNAKIMTADWATHPDIVYASMYSAAFFESDVRKLVTDAASKLPDDSPYRRGIEETLEWSLQHSDWHITRKLIHDKYYTHVDDFEVPYEMGGAVINGLIGIMSILYGEGDFMKTVSIATTAGYDCDNQAATCGGLLGIINGGGSIPDSLTKDLPSRWPWETPFNDQYINYSRDGLPNFTRISDIVTRIQRIAEQAIFENGGRKLKQDGQVVYEIVTN